MSVRVKDILLALEMGSGVSYENLAMFPLFGGAASGLAYFSLDEALERRLLEVTEVSDRGEVPNLKVTNKGERPVLILAGEELVGAKQNRLVNATFLLAGLTSIVMPVSCVEEGRWHYQEKKFQSEKRMSSPQLRTRVELDVLYAVKEGLGFRANQGGVWDEISSKMYRMNVPSPTLAMADLYTSYDDQLRRYTESFKQAEGQQGLLMAINGRVAGLELFDSPENLSKYFNKLITSYALDAIDLKEAGQPTNGLEDRARAWMTELLEVPVRTQASLGLGYDIRLEAEHLAGSGLLHDNSVLYLSAFAVAAPVKSQSESTLADFGLRWRW
ncbi:MAG: ARPP-1 family domain-containing protein [Desulfobaccales bacterium]